MDFTYDFDKTERLVANVPSATRPNAIKASIDKGVLKVTVPKPAPAQAKKIDVKSAA